MITIKKGEDKIIRLVITDSAGAPVDLTDQTVKFKVRRGALGYLYDLTNTSADHDDVAGGLTSFLLDKSVSGDVNVKSTLYGWEISIVDEVSGFVSIQDRKGSLIIKDSV